MTSYSGHNYLQKTLFFSEKSENSEKRLVLSKCKFRIIFCRHVLEEFWERIKKINIMQDKVP